MDGFGALIAFGVLMFIVILALSATVIPSIVYAILVVLLSLAHKFPKKESQLELFAVTFVILLILSILADSRGVGLPCLVLPLCVIAFVLNTLLTSLFHQTRLDKQFSWIPLPVKESLFVVLVQVGLCLLCVLLAYLLLVRQI